MAEARAGKSSRPEKILIAMRALSGGASKDLKYEDIVVKAWEMFPDDFSLRGYKLPDASDIHKPLYTTLKKGGFVIAADKRFRLTPDGLRRAQELEQPEATENGRMDRETEKELARLLKTDAYRLFAQGSTDDILDTDFYSYLSATVNMNKGQFIGRLTSVGQVIARALKHRRDPEIERLNELNQHLQQRFKREIEFMGAPNR